MSRFPSGKFDLPGGLGGEEPTIRVVGASGVILARLGAARVLGQRIRALARRLSSSRCCSNRDRVRSRPASYALSNLAGDSA